MKTESQRDAHTPMFTEAVFIMPKRGSNQVFIVGWMDKRRVVYVHTKEYYGALNRNEIDTCYNVDGPWRHYAKWNKLLTKGQILYDSTHIKYLWSNS